MVDIILQGSILERVQTREVELAGLYARMDGDAAKLDGTPYAMMRLDRPTVAVDGVVNVTMNYAATWVADLVDLILGAKVQTVIRGQKNNRLMNDKETGILEEFLDVHYEMIDDLLIDRGEPTLDDWVARQATGRGWIAASYWPYLEDGHYYTELSLWDSRFMSFENGRRELNWGACRWWRTPANILKDYPAAPISTGTELVEGVTYLDDTKEVVCIGGWESEAKPHKLGSTPVVIQACPAGLMFRNKGYMAHEGESAIWLIRGLVNQLNMNVSIEQTMALKSIMPPYSKETADSSGEPMPYPDKVGTVTEVAPGETPKLLQTGDLNQAAQLGRQDIMQALQQGGRNIDIGNINQEMSAVAIAAVGEIRKKVLVSRFDGIAMFKQKLSRKIIDYYLKLAKDIKEPVGRQGNRKVYSKDQLGGDYSICYIYLSKSKEMEIANLALYSAGVAAGLPQEDLIRDILQAENPDKILAHMASERAAKLDPTIDMIRHGHMLIDEAEGLEDWQSDAKLLESKELFDQAGKILEARHQVVTDAAMIPEVEKPKGSTQPLLPLLGAGNRGMRGGGNGQ